MSGYRSVAVGHRDDARAGDLLCVGDGLRHLLRDAVQLVEKVGLGHRRLLGVSNRKGRL